MPVIHCEKGRTIKDNRLRRILVDPLPQGAQLVALFDTCHAGTMLDLPHNACNHVVSVGLAVVVVARLHRVVASIRVRASARARAGSSATCTANINATVEVVEGRMAGMCVDVDVPRRTRRCNGDCVASVSSRAHVVSISSTADDEESWENEEGGPLTKAFVDIVDENPHLTYRELMVRLQ